METTFLSFLNKPLPYAALCARKMEEIFFTDPSGAIAKARLYIEEIINSVWALESLNTYDYNKLYDRLNYLYDQEYLNTNIYQSFDIIRRAGNRASHDAAFNDMTLAYSVHKEMYHIAVWYIEIYTHEEVVFPPYEQPVPNTSSPITNDMLEERMKLMIASMIKETKSTENIGPSTIEHEQKPTFSLERLSENGSYLEREVSRLRISSAEAVENAQSFSDFKQYLHVERPIQEKIEVVLTKRASEDTSNLILLCGSVGDGKSHLLAYLNQQRKDLMEQYIVFNDATESFSPSKTALETLEEVLKNFSDEHFGETNEKVIIAINMGVLHNFIYRKHEHFTYEKLRKFVEDSQLFSPRIMTDYEEDVFNIVSFADYQMYEISPSGVESSYFMGLIEKVCAPVKDNPFYAAYVKDIEEGNQSIIHENYLFLSNEFVQKQIVDIVIQAMVRYKISVSSRHFLNFIADLLIPNDFEAGTIQNEYNRLSQTLPNILFNSKDRSLLLDTISQLNPIHSRKNTIDELLVTLNTLTNWKVLINNKVLDETAKGWLMPFAYESDLIKGAFEVFVDSLIAILYLTDEAFAKEIEDSVYRKYIEYMYSFNKMQRPKVKEFYKEFRSAIFSWKGSPLTDYIVINRLENELATAQKLKLNPKIDHLQEMKEVKLQSFKPLITVKYADEQNGEEMLEIDFALFDLLNKVLNGYRPNKKDEEEATTFIEFLEKIMTFGDKKEEMVINFIEENKKYRLKLDEFQSFVFEKVE